jgi:hypothetical protein
MPALWVVQNVRAALAELADADYQRRVWAAEDPQGEMSSFLECVESLFTDTGLDGEFDAGRKVFGAPVDEQLKALSRLVENLGLERPPDEIISDPRMQEVRQRAAAVLATLREMRP